MPAPFKLSDMPDFSDKKIPQATVCSTYGTGYV